MDQRCNFLNLTLEQQTIVNSVIWSCIATDILLVVWDFGLRSCSVTWVFKLVKWISVCARWPISDEAASDENDIFCANYLYVFAFIIVLNCSVLFCCVLLTATLSLLLDFLKIARLVYFLFFFCFFFFYHIATSTFN